MSEDPATEALIEFLNAVEAGTAAAKQRIKDGKHIEDKEKSSWDPTKRPSQKQETPAVAEQTFLCLKFEPQEGQKIGRYDVAYEPQNLPENWTYAMNVLKANNAVIEKRYHGPGYKFAYWLFGEHKIYRQALKPPSAQ
jgi:hypothetical protein